MSKKRWVFTFTATGYGETKQEALDDAIGSCQDWLYEEPDKCACDPPATLYCQECGALMNQFHHPSCGKRAPEAPAVVREDCVVEDDDSL